jgi:CRP/FNR family transcriptional regulator, cyclic AMP receptor protein
MIPSDVPAALLNPDCWVSYREGEIILKEGEVGNYLLFLLEGAVEVQVGGLVIGTFTPIEVFGEMAAIDGQPRSATVVAKANCKLARVTEGRFEQLIQQKPELAIHVMRTLIERIRWMNSVLAKQNAPPGTESVPSLPPN